MKTFAYAAVAMLAAVPCMADEAPEMSGAELFRTFCASCHGAQARGDGPVADVLRTPPPDLTSIAARNGGVFPRERVREQIDGQRRIGAHGTREMPIWGWELYAFRGEDAARRKRVAALIERLVEYLAEIQGS